jgi:hypothetical protein
VLSPNGRYLAYRFGGGDLVVCSVADGKVLGRAPTRLTDDVGAVSDDGRYVILIDWGEGPGVVVSFPFPPPAQTVTLVDLETGSRTVPAVIADLVTDRTHGDYWVNGVVWLSADDAFLLDIPGTTGPPAHTNTQETYLYDPAKDSLTKVSGLDELGSSAVSRDGGVLGRVRVQSSSGEDQSDESQPVVWQAGTSQGFVFDPSWPGGPGAISPDGSVVMLGVGGMPGTSPAWQAFRRVDNEWRPSSQAWPFSSRSTQSSPMYVGADDRTAWGAAYEPLSADPTRQHSYLVSLDTVAGTRTEWFRLIDLKVAPEEFDILQVIFP